MRKPIIAVVLGSILGLLGARYVFVGSWLNLVLWGIAGVALGSWGTKHEAIVDGVIFGFVLTFVYMVAEYSGPFSLASRLPFFVFLGVFGAACGLVLGVVGFQTKARLVKKKKRS